jgi:predicted phage terminase large subunit-like protein
MPESNSALSPEVIAQSNATGLSALSLIFTYPFAAALTAYQGLSQLPPDLKAITYHHLGKLDLFFLLTHMLRRPDAINEWYYARCREVQAAPNGYLDLWFREGGKTSIISFALTIFDILNNPEITIAFFSQTRPAAKKLLRTIKQEFEENELLKSLYPNILWANPSAQAPKWNEDEGLVVKRVSNPKEATIESWGLVDGQPAGPHWDLIVYDDVVTKTSVTTPEMIEKTNEMWELSLPLSKVGGKRRYIGTYYHFNDTYHLIEKRGAAIPRKYPATKNGMVDGEPVFMSKEELDKRRREWGAATYSCQMLLDASSDSRQGFKKEWLKFWDATNLTGLNTIILCDPAGTKKRSSGHDPDYTVFILLGYGQDENWYVCDMVRDRLNLTERADVLFEWHRHYRPLFVGYEKYGKDSDIEHVQDRMNRENYRFEIEELGGITKKSERIGSLIPDFEQGRLYLPKTLLYTNSEGKERDLIQDFINEEYLAFPVATHDDILDCLARKNNAAVPKISRGTTTTFTPNRGHLATQGNWRFLPKSWRPRRAGYGDGE